MSTLKFVYCKISPKKTNMPKFGTKNALFGYFCCGILKKYCHIWNQHPRVCLIGEFCKKTKMPIFGNKNALLKYFGLVFEKNYCHIWNLDPRVCLMREFCKKTKMPTFGSKNALFKYFGLAFEKKLLSYLKSAPSNLSHCKILQKKRKA